MTRWIVTIASRILSRQTPAERLAATLRPDPESRAKRLSQWSRERQQRYWDAVEGEPQSLRALR